jgi:serine/threonine protein kinase/DNA-binding beta-propeller fold protein YncE
MADLSGRVLGDYILREKIGGGGYGDVYRADHRLLKRVAVVKVLNGERQCSHDAKVRFLLEAQLASQLRHPYAAHVYDFGVTDEDGLHWIAMELVDGVTLGEWLEKHGPMGLEELVPFFEYVSEVVHAAHSAGIIHRDLKPSNVMVMERNGLLVPKLLDFGVAKGRVAPLVEDEEPIDVSGGDKVVTALIQATARITHTGSAVGSRPYMSPEQWGNASGVGPAADVYSLGIIIYEALTGRLPFPAESTDDYFRYHCQAPVPVLGRGFSPDLDRVVFRALAKVPEHRHGNVLELAADLRAVLQADPREQIRSWTRRWHERGRSPDLLARGQVLKDVERYVHRVGEEALSDLECSFVMNSQRLARNIRWFLRSLVALAAVVVVGFAAMQLRAARQLAEVTVTQAELEQGRSALLHGEPEALPHLAEAYKRGERSLSTKFMFARAAQPRLAEQARFTSTSGRMWSATFSPDGRQIVTTDDRAAQVWDAQTYRMLFGLPHGSEVYHAVYSADGKRLVTAAQDAIRIWDATSGALVRTLTQKRNDRKLDYYIAAISFDGRLVAVIDVKGAAAHVWDAVTGVEIAELPNDDSGFPGLTFSSDGHWLAATGGKEAHVFDTSTWAQVCSILRVRRLAFDPTGARLVTGSIDGLYPSSDPWFNLPQCVDEFSTAPCGPGQTFSVILHAGSFSVSFDVLPAASSFDIAAVGTGGASIISIDPAARAYNASVTTITPQAAIGDFSKSVAQLWDYASCDQTMLCQAFPGPNILPASRLDAYWLKATGQLPVPAAAAPTSPNAVVQVSGSLSGSRMVIDAQNNTALSKFGGIVQAPLGPFAKAVSTFKLYVDGRLVVSKDFPYTVIAR